MIKVAGVDEQKIKATTESENSKNQSEPKNDVSAPAPQKKPKVKKLSVSDAAIQLLEVCNLSDSDKLALARTLMPESLGLYNKEEAKEIPYSNGALAIKPL